MVAPDRTVTSWGWPALLPAWDPRLLWATLALVGALLVGALIIALVDRWRRRPPSEERFSSSDQLARFRTLYEAGEISPEEFAQIRGRLTERMLRETEVPPAPPAAASPAPAPPRPPDQSAP
jgi:hypothetical protein